MKTIKILSIILLSGLLVFSCKKDESPGIPEQVLELNKFVWENMKSYYLWTDSIGEFDYLKEPDTKDFFNKLLYDKIDQWSFITDDAQALQDLFDGKQISTGYDYRPFKINSTDLVCYITYVEPDSPADEAELHRGMMFYKINGQTLTTDNFSKLIQQETQELTFGILNNDLTVSPTSPSVRVTAIERQSNPIFLHKILSYGSDKIGYLVYNSFIDDYDEQLIEVFGDFKAAGVNHLVLDLRYNSGGAVSSAILLSSLIAPENKVGEVLIKSAYNKYYTSYLNSNYPDEDYNNYLTQQTNNLNLDEIVVLTSPYTASASEMVIYGLEPHMTVYQIGEQTHGKYYASVTIDDPKKHTWAMQPIVIRVENKDNSIDYTVGLSPDQPRIDFNSAMQDGIDLTTELGDPTEDFLSLAIKHITGTKPTSTQLKSTISSSLISTDIKWKAEHPLKDNMYVDKAD